MCFCFYPHLLFQTLFSLLNVQGVTETQIDIHVRCPLSGLDSATRSSTTINEKISSFPQLETVQMTQNFITIISNK